MMNILANFFASGLLQMSWWQDILVVLVLTHITIISVTLYLHRSQAHRALDLHPIISHFFRFWLWLTTGMVTREWVGIHRKHHARCETEEDPHSPQVLGLKKLMLEGAELYRKAAKDKDMVARYSHGAPNDWIERHLYSAHSAMGIVLMLVIDLLLFGLPGLSMWAVQMLWIPVLAAGVVNGIGHYFGYRNFECADASKNIIPWGILIGGEELHNNHHTYGSSAKLSVKKWEFDIGWFYINVLRSFNLAKVRRVPPQAVVKPGKLSVDEETLTAVLANRFQVMAHYSKEVIAPVFAAERLVSEREGGAIKRRVRKLLIREASLMKQKDEKHLKDVIADRETLKTVYQYRLKLQEIWARTTASKNELIEAIGDWCHQAEQSGIDALRRFAGKLRSYSPVAATV